MARAFGDFTEQWNWVRENFYFEISDPEADDPSTTRSHSYCNRCEEEVWYHTKHARNAHGDDIEIWPLASSIDDSDEFGRRDPNKPRRWKYPQLNPWPESVDKCPGCQSPAITETFTLGDDSNKWNCRNCGMCGSVVASECCPTCNKETAYVLDTTY